LGRKNYLFAGDHDAAQRGAVVYTIIANCKAIDINPTDYPADVLDSVVTRKLSNLDDLLPWNWKPLEKFIQKVET
jgi:transposase